MERPEKRSKSRKGPRGRRSKVKGVKEHRAKSIEQRAKSIEQRAEELVIG